MGARVVVGCGGSMFALNWNGYDGPALRFSPTATGDVCWKWSNNSENEQIHANGDLEWSQSVTCIDSRLTGSFEAGTVPTLLAAINWSTWLIERRLLPSKLPNDSPKPSSSPTLKPVFSVWIRVKIAVISTQAKLFFHFECVWAFAVCRRIC